MILNQISLLDCLAFVIFLAPQLFIQVGAGATFKCLSQMLPFLLLSLPYQLLTIDVLTHRRDRPPYHAHAPFFTSLVIRCVRYAFANLPAPIGRVFFSKPVALPFARFRMFRHGYWPYPSTAEPTSVARTAHRIGFKPPDCHFEEKVLEGGSKGVWVIKDPSQPPDVVVYYLHGGGFSMGSPWFYLEFLMAWVHLLARPSPDSSQGKGGKQTGNGEKSSRTGAAFRNPALFALDYTLVPAATFPTQLEQTLQGYDFVRSTLSSSTATAASPPIELAGDSAGATLALSLLLLLSKDPASSSTSTSPTASPQSSSPAHNTRSSTQNQTHRPLPRHATLISPWCRLVSPQNKDTPSDFLNREALHLYARQYVGAMPADAGSKDEQADGGSGEAGDAVGGDGDSEGNDDGSSEAMIDSKKRTTNPLASPGDCTSAPWWRRAVPPSRIHFVHGAEEAFAPESLALATRIKHALDEGEGSPAGDSDGNRNRKGSTDKEEGERLVKMTQEPAQIHAWPVVALFLGVGREDRLRGLVAIVEEMRGRMRIGVL